MTQVNPDIHVNGADIYYQGEINPAGAQKLKFLIPQDPSINTLYINSKWEK